MANKIVQQIEVVFIETFKGGKFLFRTDKPYEREITNLFTGLIEQCPLGSIAHVSKRLVDEDKYQRSRHVEIVDGMLNTNPRKDR